MRNFIILVSCISNKKMKKKKAGHLMLVTNSCFNEMINLHWHWHFFRKNIFEPSKLPIFYIKNISSLHGCSTYGVLDPSAPQKHFHDSNCP